MPLEPRALWSDRPRPPPSCARMLTWHVSAGVHSRRRGCLNDTTLFDTEAMQWEPLQASTHTHTRPPPGPTRRAPSPSHAPYLDRSVVSQCHALASSQRPSSAPCDCPHSCPCSGPLPTQIAGALPPPRGNHAAVVVSDRLWLFGGDVGNGSTLPSTVWSLLLSPQGDESIWAAVSATGEPAPPCCDHTAVALGSTILLLGGSESSGYRSFEQIPTFDTDKLSWARLRCGGAVPSARAGHVAAAISSGDASGAPGAHIYIFGGGNSLTGFDDLHVLHTATSRWTKLASCTRAEDLAAQPPATEGAALATSGGLLLVYGGYTAAGATRKCYAWGCEVEATEMGNGEMGWRATAAADTGAGIGVVESSRGGGAGRGDGGRPVVLLACSASGGGGQRHAQLGESAMVDALPGVQVQVVLALT